MFDDIFSKLPSKKTTAMTNGDEQLGAIESKPEPEVSASPLNDGSDDGKLLEESSISPNDQLLAFDILGVLDENASSAEAISAESEAVDAASHSTINLSTEVANDIDKHIDDWFKSCLRLAGVIHCDEIITALIELDVRWQFPGFRLAFVGEFSRGKSTLINRLLGQDLLPVGVRPTTGTLISIVSGATEKMEVCTPEGWVARALEPSSWDDLLAEDLADDTRDQLTQVRLTVDCPWLRTIDVELIDTPGAGDLNSSRTALLCDVLSRCDAAVILVSATLPFSLTEATFLEQEVLGRHIPNTLVAVSKLDTVPQTEKLGLLAVIRDRVTEISADVPTIPIHPLAASSSNEDTLEEVRVQIEKMAAKGERKFWRIRKVSSQILDYLTQISKLSQATIDAARMSDADKQAAIRQATQQKENTELYWEDLRLEIDSRRLQHTRHLKEEIAQAKEEIGSTYAFDLEKVRDLKGWWERDLPFQLRRELLLLGNRLGTEMLTKLSDDFEWVQTEVHQKFDQQVVTTHSASSSAVKLNLDLSHLQLTDIRHFAILTGLASSATTVCGYVFGGPAGAVVSTTAWVVSDQFIHYKTNEQRRLLSKELAINLDRVASDYCAQISERLRELYDQLIDELSKEQRMWQSAWESTLTSRPSQQDVSQYRDLLEQVADLKQEIQSMSST